MKKNFRLSILLIALTVLIPVSSFGASIFVESSTETLHVGDQVVLRVILNTENANINTIDGEISLTDVSTSLLIKEINIAQSGFTLWPRTPSLSNDRRSISFVGGVPGGLMDDNVHVFNIVIEALRPGKAVLTEKDVTVFLNDGKGTSLKPTFAPKTINVIEGTSDTIIKEEWAGVVSGDTRSPEKFDIEMGSDESVFEGKKFISFSTTDNDSGIDYYVVTEGSLAPVRSGSTYVLQNQNATEVITVSAYDKAGNVTVSEFDPNSMSSRGKATVILLIILAIIFAVQYFNKSKIKHDIK